MPAAGSCGSAEKRKKEPPRGLPNGEEEEYNVPVGYLLTIPDSNDKRRASRGRSAARILFWDGRHSILLIDRHILQKFSSEMTKKGLKTGERSVII